MTRCYIFSFKNNGVDKIVWKSFLIRKRREKTKVGKKKSKQASIINDGKELFQKIVCKPLLITAAPFIYYSDFFFLSRFITILFLIYKYLCFSFVCCEYIYFIIKRDILSLHFHFISYLQAHIISHVGLREDGKI